MTNDESRNQVMLTELEGGLLEFPSLEQARRWYASSEYARIKALRLEHAETQLAFVEGIPSS